MSADVSPTNNPVQKQRLENITFSSAGKKECPNLADTGPWLDQNTQSIVYSHPTTVIESVTASYAVPKSCLVTVLKS